MTKNRVFINGFESICCAGTNSDELFKAICSQQSGIRIDTQWIPTKRVALGKIPYEFSLEEILYLTCKKVLDTCHIQNTESILLVVGSSVGGMRQSEKTFFKDHDYAHINPELHNINAIAHILTKQFSFKDDISFSTACTSSANALGYGFEMISKGVYEQVLVVGVDTLSYTTVRGFDALGVLSSLPCKPFDNNRDGMNVAEGIGVLLLEKCLKDESVEIFGVGYSSDAHHMTQPSPEGLGAYNAMQKALKSAGLEASKVEYINAHGTGTKANDASEACAIQKLFPHHPFVSSTKSITGHALGAAGALEAIICAMALQQQIIPPNTHLDSPENEALNYSYMPQKQKLRYVLSNSLAFGGNNTSLLLGLPRER